MELPSPLARRPRPAVGSGRSFPAAKAEGTMTSRAGRKSRRPDSPVGTLPWRSRECAGFERIATRLVSASLMLALLVGLSCSKGESKRGRAARPGDSQTKTARDRDRSRPAKVRWPTVSGLRQKAQIDATKVRISAIENALDAFNLDVGRCPTAEEELAALVTKPEFEEEQLARNWRGPYLKEAPKDAWGRQFNYERVDPDGGEDVTVPYRLWSNGPDGQDGTEDDIKSWSDNEEE